MSETLTLADIDGDPFGENVLVGLDVHTGDGEVLMSFWLNGHFLTVSLDTETAAQLSMAFLQCAMELDDG